MNLTILTKKFSMTWNVDGMEQTEQDVDGMIGKRTNKEQTIRPLF